MPFGPGAGIGRHALHAPGGSWSARRARMASIKTTPGSGPSRIATATARFSSITGDGSICRSTSYRATIWPQSVASASVAPACTAAMAA